MEGGQQVDTQDWYESRDRRCLAVHDLSRHYSLTHHRVGHTVISALPRLAMIKPVLLHAEVDRRIPAHVTPIG